MVSGEDREGVQETQNKSPCNDIKMTGGASYVLESQLFDTLCSIISM